MRTISHMGVVLFLFYCTDISSSGWELLYIKMYDYFLFHEGWGAGVDTQSCSWLVGHKTLDGKYRCFVCNAMQCNALVVVVILI